MKRLDEMREFWRTADVQSAGTTRVSPDWQWPWDAARVARYFDTLTQGRPMAGATVLDVGCGVGRFTLEAIQRGAVRVYSVDVSPEMLQHLAEYTGHDPRVVPVLSRGDGWDGVPVGSCDAAWCYLVLQHQWSREAGEGLVDGMLAALKPGGRFFLQGHHLKGRPVGWGGTGFEGQDFTPGEMEAFLHSRGQAPVRIERLFDEARWWAFTFERAG